MRVNGVVRRDPEFAVLMGADRLEVDGQSIGASDRVYLMLNKPRGLVTTASDEKGRRTVFECFQGHDLPHVSPVGRLDQASEGLLLFTNDTIWANQITDPASGCEKCYHVQVNQRFDPQWKHAAELGRSIDGERLKAQTLELLREGEKNCWLVITLQEGKNRHIRRLLSSLELEVLRLIRVSIDCLELGNLAKGHYRHLSPLEVRTLGSPAFQKASSRRGQPDQTHH